MTEGIKKFPIINLKISQPGRERACAEHKLIHGQQKVWTRNNSPFHTLKENKLHKVPNQETIMVLIT